jgi:imidazole glycerol-phosphate synthase subunit HisH
MIAIVDYGLGNVQAFLNVYKRLNVPAQRATTIDELRGASKVILPGVGAFDHAMERLDASRMRDALDELVLERKTPVLGVCVGMQILARSSEEGTRPGLGWIDGRVRQFSAAAGPLPHMGWNDVQPAEDNALFRDLESDAKFYFLHSFYFECARPEHVAATSSYGAPFSSAVCASNIYGVQFHPEKSHHYGIRLLHNFASLQDS